MSVYPAQIAQIAAKLQAWAKTSRAQLLFGITSPMLGDARADQDVSSLNSAAAAAMRTAGVPTVDLHAAIVGKCGAVPQSSCFGIQGWCVVLPPC